MNDATIIFNSVDLFETWGVRVTQRPWPYMPAPRVWIENLGDANGAVTAGRTFDARTFSVECAVEDNTGNLETTLDAIAAHFATAHAAGGLKQLVFGYRPTVQWQARLVSEIRFEAALNGATFNLEFIAPDPTGTPYHEGT
jgi:predicted phage tail component-like protein